MEVKMKRLLLLTLLVSSMLSGVFASETKEEKVQRLIKAHKLTVANFDDVKKAIGKGTKKTAKAIILDARPFAKYKQAHIPTATGLPDTKFDKLYKIALGKKPKDMPIITYCGGLKCAKSVKVAIALKKKGHTNIKVYTQGMPEWKKKSYVEIAEKTALKLHQKQDVLFLDARPYSKFAKGTILGALATPDTQFDKFKKLMPHDKNVHIITFCGGYKCAKSHKIANILVKMGYKNVKVFAAGYPKWKKKKYPTTAGGVVKKKPTKQKRKKLAFVEPDMVDGVVNGKWFVKNYMTFPTTVKIIDIRSAEDYNLGHLMGAINIDAEKLNAKEFIAKLPKTGELIFTCNSGAMALEAFLKLKDAKYEEILRVFYLDANIDCDKNSKCKIEVNESL
jgi:rhodanese-related sulfurtransferase